MHNKVIQAAVTLLKKIDQFLWYKKHITHLTANYPENLLGNPFFGLLKSLPHRVIETFWFLKTIKY